MSTVTVAEVEALMSSGLGTDALQGIIDREEAWLADDPVVGIGQLEGERTVRLWTNGDPDPILLRRPTSLLAGGSSSPLTVEVDGVLADDVVLTGPTRLERRDHAWGDVADVTFTPTDLPSVKTVILELVRLRLTSSPYQSESTEGHTYGRSIDVEAERRRLARSLNPNRGAGSIALRPGSPGSHRITSPT